MNHDLFDADQADHFPPTPAAAQARLAAVRPGEYARTRNHLDGAVTRLSPYITHGFLSLPQVLQAVHARHPLDAQHKFVFELGWRAYFHHVWQHRGAAIFESLHQGVLPDAAYARELPADIAAGCTGLPVIDRAVHELHATGWLHNHARMWLASYVVHLRKVHWRTGADWLYGHLLDGDLASNHLSWQWVAGTGSHKPYLFNAENVARYAPAPWHSPSSVIDTDYDTLERMAASTRPVPHSKSHASPEERVPSLWTVPPETPSSGDLRAAFDAVDAQALQGREVQLLHPWSLGAAPQPGALRLGVCIADFHAVWPWSARRWQFVITRLRAQCEQLWWVDAATLRAALAGAAAVHGVADPHLQPWLPGLALQAAPRLFAEPAQPCHSFSKYWQKVSRGVFAAASPSQ